MSPARWARGVVIERPGQPSAGLVRWLERWLAPVVRWAHRPRLEGIEHLPATGPFLLVANHSGGLGISEILTFAVLYLGTFGATRPLAGFAHPVGFVAWPLSRLLPALGAVPSSYEAAEKTLAAGVPLLIFPGGDHETFRPLWEANRVDFGGRVGFLRIARQARVAVVPMGIRGGHFTAPVLFRSRALATLLVVPRLLGTRRWGLSVLGVIGAVLIGALVPWGWGARAALIWLWLGSPVVFLPWLPWPLRFRLGPPIPAATLFPAGSSGGDDELRSAYGRVRGAVQALVDDDPARSTRA